ncbi:hypothetical protein AS188_02070 [Kocuria flava]|uniref:Uncharacterized protein n=1 Tax=Kocuria flava TaxID=446860 RepID=A0A0U3I5T0_9MICC|nr:hypothetical protein [Kocuria flava]ALU38732.1 hypothetical protein AS188_02070 [Kocuria flava]GEO92250.1 hypothetical protein KFL01_15560 [Kocuria flava]
MHPFPTPTPRRAPARTGRWAVPVAAVLLLAGCADPGPGGSGRTGAAPGPSSSAPVPTATAPADGRWGSYGGRAEACAAVADHVLTLSVLPSSLSVTGRVEDVQQVEDQVADLVEAAPEELVADLARIQLTVDSYGEDLAAGQSATAAPDGPRARFDRRALEDSLGSLRRWLADACADDGG